MDCPCCSGVKLAGEHFDGRTIQRCPSCQGLWLEGLQLQELVTAKPRKLLAADAAAPRREEKPAKLACPHCRGTHLIKLNSRVRPGTLIDSCTVCFGSWLDAGDLTQLVRGKSGGWLMGLFSRRAR